MRCCLSSSPSARRCVPVATGHCFTGSTVQICRKLFGGAADGSWELLLSVGDHVFHDRRETAEFPIKPNGEATYNEYKLLITSIRDPQKADHVHLAELALEGMPAPSAPESGERARVFVTEAHPPFLGNRKSKTPLAHCLPPTLSHPPTLIRLLICSNATSVRRLQGRARLCLLFSRRKQHAKRRGPRLGL